MVLKEIGFHNTSYLEELYRLYRQHPERFDAETDRFFRELEKQSTQQPAPATQQLAPMLPSSSHSHNNSKVEAMINSFRRRGHLFADLNPLRVENSKHFSLQDYGLQSVDAGQKFYPTDLAGVYGATAQEILNILVQSYSGVIGVDYVEINNEERVEWISRKLEQCAGRMTFNPKEQEKILRDLVAAEGLERFLHTRYLGQKRFSLEGCDVLVPMLDFMLTSAVNSGVEEACIGMAHRGRLNVLANVMRKDLSSLLNEFEDSVEYSFDIDGDVKYHIGFTSKGEENKRGIDLTLLPNPSHLEAINPVLEGYVRARQRLRQDTTGKKVLPLLIHGDASFSGQGVVFETLNLSKLASYSTGGTVHIIIDNQIGFTTDQCCARSMEYCSDIVKAIRAPVFHVNADQPEAAVLTALLAFSYRQKFNSDVVIDIVGYRRYGHNEGDEPSYTQPLMYQTIGKHPRVLETYSKKLQQENSISDETTNANKADYRQKLTDAYQRIKSGKVSKGKIISTTKKTKNNVAAMTVAHLSTLATKITTVPADFTPNPKIKKIFQQRLAMCQGKGNVDWALAELLALASLAEAGHHVRFSGQDVQRGTFSSRHAVVSDINNGNLYAVFTPFSVVEIINSPLSEFGALGFEFGYSMVDHRALILWEAQFGDFANGAQIIIDQFLSACEAKWGLSSGMVLLLPHGYEGMGPEHSSARPERFLQLCGNNNMQVASPTTAAQYFHLLRRQVIQSVQKPLIIMSPKSLLRHPAVASPLLAFCKGASFQEILDDEEADVAKVKRLLLCTGKIFYELRARQQKLKDNSVAIVRLEYLYPFPRKALTRIISKYKKITKIFWVQEEPQNMGSWHYIRAKIEEVDAERLHYIGRKTSGTTAEGSMKAHLNAQNRIIDKAFVKE